MTSEIKKIDDVIEKLRNVETSYPGEISDFCDYLEDNGLTLNEDGINQYLSSLKSRKRQVKGKMVSYSAAWYNQRLKAIKQAIRYFLDRSPEITNGRRYGIERFLQNQKQLKPKEGISNESAVPTKAEYETLVYEADPRLSLMLEFLYQTSCRVSEMLEAETGKVKRGERITYIGISGKGEKERSLKLSTKLYDRICEEFQGQNLLFEHGGKGYSRVSVTNRIKQLAQRTIGKPTTAHAIRHLRGTELSELYGISKAASELGHSSIKTTKQFYDHSKLDDAEFLDSINNGK